jgi:dephospho-CoA kinase
MQQWEKETPNAVAIIDAALMIESGGYKRFDKLIVVHCKPETQIQRLMKRNSLTRDEAERRVKTQMPQEEKKKYADYLIDSSGELADTRGKIEAVWQALQALIPHPTNRA